MKKLTVTLAIVTMLNFAPQISHMAYASPVLDLAQVDKVLQEQMKRITPQDIARIQEEVTRGDKNSIIKTIAEIVTNNAVQDQSIQTLITEEVNSRIVPIVQNEIEQALGDKVSSYQKALEMFLNTKNTTATTPTNTATITPTNTTKTTATTIPTTKNTTTITPQTKTQPDTKNNQPSSYKRIINMTATAYAPGMLDNGKWGNLNYMGGLVQKGIVAVDPRVIPMGSKVWVEGYGEAVAADQGSAIQGNRIDLAFNSRPEALNYGIQQVKVYLIQ